MTTPTDNADGVLFTMEIPHDLYYELVDQSAMTGRTMADRIIETIREHLSERPS